jgi:nitrate reductase gamma subunit
LRMLYANAPCAMRYSREVAVDTVIYFILVPMVYISFAVFIFGTAIRLIKIFREPKNPAPLQVYPAKNPKWLWALHDTFLFPTVRRHKPVLWVFLILFHAGLFLLIIGHLELFADIKILQVIPHEIFLGQGYLGLLLAIALLYFLFRRFTSPVRDLSVPEDYYLLILLFLIVIFGSEMDWARRWYGYEELTVEEYREYLMSLLYLKPYLPDAVTDSGHSFMLVLHVFFANLFLLFFPFSQSMHSFLSLPVNKLRTG